MKDNVKILKNVKIGKDAQIQDFVIIGVPPKGKSEGELETIIGDNAIIRSHSVIYAGNKIGDNFQTGHGVTIREQNVIGSNVSIGTKSVIEHHVKIEDNVRIHSQAFVPEFCLLKKNSWIGPKVVFTNAKYPKSMDAKKTLRGPIVEEDAKIGANSTILPGVTIGKGSLIGAGSVVAKNIPAKKVATGNPAEVIKDIGSLKAY
jgi:acetyltransferase-like isoleucine patch superfamily enzyme